MLAFMHAQNTFFHQGHDLFGDLEPYMKDIANQVRKLFQLYTMYQYLLLTFLKTLPHFVLNIFYSIYQGPALIAQWSKAL